jgi:hypothetical protein
VKRDGEFDGLNSRNFVDVSGRRSDRRVLQVVRVEALLKTSSLFLLKKYFITVWRKNCLACTSDTLFSFKLFSNHIDKY